MSTDDQEAKPRASARLRQWSHCFEPGTPLYHMPKMAYELRQIACYIEALEEALTFYADPETYFAIAFLADPPCGDFMADFSQTELGKKPGARARATLDWDCDLLPD